MSVIRIGVDLRSLVGELTGIGVYTLSILEQLADDRELEFVGLTHAELNPSVDLDSLNLTIEVERSALGVLWQRVKLPRRLARGDLDLFWSPLLTLPPRPAVPSIVTVHDMTPLLFPRDHHWKVRLSTRPFLASSVAQAHSIVACSRTTADDVQRYFPQVAEKIRVVYNGVDEVFRPGDRGEIETIRREIGCGGGYLLFSGTLEPRKNVAGLLDAWQSLRDQLPSALPLVLTGPYGWHSRGLMQRIEALESDGVLYLGRLPRQRLIEVMRGASVFVFPSFYEGFGLPVLEAMASGVPTVTSSVSSLPEVAGDAALLVDPGDPAAIASAMRSILTRPELAADLGRRGRERSRSFSWRRTADAMRDLFRTASSRQS